MANTFEKLSFTKDWNNSADFPTYEENEAKVRADLQALHDETKNFINDKLIPGIENLAVPGSGDMLAAVYDPQKKRTDVYQYAENAVQNVADSLSNHTASANPHNVTADQVAVTQSVVDALKETGSWSVDGILEQIGSTLFGGDVLYRWQKAKYTLTEEEYGDIYTQVTGSYQIRYSSKIVVNADNTITLVDSTSRQISDSVNFTIPEGMYFIASHAVTAPTVFRAKSNSVATIKTVVNKYYQSITNVLKVMGTADIELVTSTDPNAHYDGEVDAEGYTYTALDPITAFVPRIQTGSYTGTGTYGASNPCSLTFSFAPKFVLVMRSTSTTHVATSGHSLTWTGQPGASSGNECAIALSDKTLSWYGTSAAYQLNVSNNPYYWVAIG